MSPDQIKVLLALEDSDGDFSYQCFAAISRRCGLNRKRVRRAVRALARKGFAKFAKGLWTEDGDPYGSGYAITDEGLLQPPVIARREKKAAARKALVSRHSRPA